jgi:hypothetical protein
METQVCYRNTNHCEQFPVPVCLQGPFVLFLTALPCRPFGQKCCDATYECYPRAPLSEHATLLSRSGEQGERERERERERVVKVDKRDVERTRG